MLDLGTTLLGAAERYPDREAVVDGATRWTYGGWFECVRQVAGGLVEAGLRPGDHLVIVLKNRWQMAALHWACQLVGVIATPINWRAKSEEIDFVLRDADAKAVAFEMSTEITVKEAASAHFITSIAVSGDGDLSLDDLIASKPVTVAGRARAEDMSVMLYTSGTTGLGKGVPRSHQAERAAAMAHIVQNGYRLGERTLGVMPLYHTMGIRSLLSMALINGCFICQYHFDAEETLMLIEHERVTALFLVPTLYHDLMSHESFSSRDLSSVRKLGFAGAPMEGGLLQRVNEAFNPELFVNHYGSSEIYTFTVEPHASEKPGSAGKAGVNQRIRVIKIGSKDPEDHVSTGETGEIIADLASDEAFKGYWRRTDADEKVLRDGWYFTGDIGWLDNHGDLFLAGRIDDMIITGGENVSPAEIEKILSAHPEVVEVAVAGLADERWGQQVTAFIKARKAVSPDELDVFCRGSALADFKRPRNYVFVTAIPKSPVGKVLRRLLVSGDYEVDKRFLGKTENEMATLA